MRYVGYLLTLLAGVGLGWYASHRLTRRVAALTWLERLMDTLLRQTAYTALPMKTLWRQLAQDGSFAACPLVAETVAGLEDCTFSEAFGAAVERLAARDWLWPSEKEVLLRFCRECGQYDLSRQTAQLRRCGEELGALRREAAEAASSRGRLYRVMGAAGGGALVLLLL